MDVKKPIVIGLSLLALVAGTIACAADVMEFRLGVYLFKPLATSLILGLALVACEGFDPRYRLSIVAGLFFSLLGDVFLMLPGDWFVWGLGGFLVAHVLYLVAFTSGARLAARWEPFAVVAVIAGVMLAVLWPKLKPDLRIPVVLYVVMLGSMAAQGVARTMTLGRVALFAGIGGSLFMVSDALLAFARFHTPFTGSRVGVLSTYWIAQWFIAMSVAGSRRE